MYVHPFAFASIAASLADDAFRATASMPSPVSVAIKRCRNSSVEIEAFALLLNSTIPTFGRAAAGFDMFEGRLGFPPWVASGCWAIDIASAIENEYNSCE